MSQSTTPIEDAFDIFGRSVAMQLKTFSEETALIAQCRFQNILTELGLQDLKVKRGSTSTPLYITPASCTSVTSLSSGDPASPMKQSDLLVGQQMICLLYITIIPIQQP
jgi:hypothetical protein